MIFKQNIIDLIYQVFLHKNSDEPLNTRCLFFPEEHEIGRITFSVNKSRKKIDSL